MTGRSLALAACLLLLSASPRSGAASPMGANGPTSPIGSADPLRLPDLSDGDSGIRIPRSAWMALAVGGVLARDSLRRENAAEAAYVLDRSFLDGPADVGNVWGNGLAVAAGSAGLFGLGVLTREPSLRDAGKDLGTAFLATSAVVLPMKIFVDRTRPNGGRYSFPSGHTALAFATAPVLSAHFGAHRPWCGDHRAVLAGNRGTHLEPPASALLAPLTSTPRSRRDRIAIAGS